MSERISFFGSTKDTKNQLIQKISDEVFSILYEISSKESTPFSGILYGSISTLNQKEGSDIDIMFFGESSPLPDSFIYTENKIKKISINLGLEIDEEIPYRNKLFFSKREITNSLLCRGLPNDKMGGLMIPDIVCKKQLSDITTKLRLGTNILTTPNIGFFIDEQEDIYYRSIKHEAALTLQSMGLKIQRNLGLDRNRMELYKTLTDSDTGKTGRDFLGYKVERPLVKRYMLEQLGVSFSKEELTERINKLGF